MMLKKLQTQLRSELVLENLETEDTEPEEVHLSFMVVRMSHLLELLRNVPGVETVHVSRLNLLQLAPGGHVGRFCHLD
jgi:ribosomal protein L4